MGVDFLSLKFPLNLVSLDGRLSFRSVVVSLMPQ